MPAEEIFIQATDTDPAVIARAAMREAHRRLRDRLAELTQAAAGQRPVADLVDFCRHELRDHLVVAERDLYAPASRVAETRLLADALRVGNAVLNHQINDLAVATASEAVRIATMIAGALDLYLRIEESAAPVLADLAGIDPSLVEADQQGVVDVRQIARGGRHPRVFARYARLAPGETFILINSHDPKPLRREFESVYPGAYSWDYLQAGPEEWRVRIGRVTADA
ncbi:DUF2249 domain-containing protein [Kribbella sp. NPDC000426]|uniref:DUF2249 domain-containing protein n=1 Tax=Kribbella sp. NPDC000426 TaxID=3154255 RepID=UPI00332D2B05